MVRMTMAVVLALLGFGCAADMDDSGTEQALVKTACADLAEAWCEEAVACDEDALVNGPADYDRCVAGVTDGCLGGWNLQIVDELDVCLEAIASMECSIAFGLPEACHWRDG